MSYKKRKCYLCGKLYEYCGNCVEFAGKPAFLSTFHDENCKTIFHICTDFNMGLLSKADAKRALLNCNLSEKKNFTKDAQVTIDKILADDTKKEFIKKPTHEVVK